MHKCNKFLTSSWRSSRVAACWRWSTQWMECRGFCGTGLRRRRSMASCWDCWVPLGCGAGMIVRSTGFFWPRRTMTCLRCACRATWRRPHQTRSTGGAEPSCQTKQFVLSCLEVEVIQARSVNSIGLNTYGMWLLPEVRWKRKGCSLFFHSHLSASPNSLSFAFFCLLFLTSRSSGLEWRPTFFWYYVSANNFVLILLHLSAILTSFSPYIRARLHGWQGKEIKGEPNDSSIFILFIIWYNMFVCPADIIFLCNIAYNRSRWVLIIWHNHTSIQISSMVSTTDGLRNWIKWQLIFIGSRQAGSPREEQAGIYRGVCQHCYFLICCTWIKITRSIYIGIGTTYRTST